MDIKLVKNFEEGQYTTLNSELVLQMVDDNYKFNDYIGKKLFVLNPDTNEQFEIMPEIKKYDIVEINYATLEHDYVVFTSAESINSENILLTFYRYFISTGESIIIYKQEISPSSIRKSLDVKMFVLDETYSIIETVRYSDDINVTQMLISKGPGKHQLILHDDSSDKNLVISESIVAKSGIDKIIPLGGNRCAVKIGSAAIEQDINGSLKFSRDEEEVIGIVNVKQFISEISLNTDNVYLDILDKCDKDVTFPYMTKHDSCIVYSKVDVSRKVEEVIIYNYESNVRKVRLNSNITRISDLNQTYLIGDNPYIIKNTDKSTELINLNTQKVDVKISAETRIKYICKDMIVTQKHVNKLLLRKESNYIEVFRFPDMDNPIFSTRGKYKKCICHYDELLIFTG